MKRLYGIDLIKSLAIFFVISVHFFLNSGYYDTVMSGKSMLIMTGARWLFFTCVPLFLLATGFLRYKKTPTKKYYLSLISIYVSYFIAAGISSVFKYNFLDESSNGIFFELLGILSFKNGYSWYMEMFFGFALLLPFVNLAYNSLKTKKEKLLSIGILLFLTAVCSLNFCVSIYEKTYYLLPDYWTFLYPFSYYLIGAYISEYKPKINKLFGTAFLIVIIGLETVYTYIRCKEEFFNWGLLGGYGGITVVISTVVLFLLLYDLDIKNGFLREVLKSISKKTLDIYMISYLFDLMFYPILKKATPDFLSRIKYAPIMVIAVFACAYAYASLKDIVFDAVIFLWNKAYSERAREEENEPVSADI